MDSGRSDLARAAGKASAASTVPEFEASAPAKEKKSPAKDFEACADVRKGKNLKIVGRREGQQSAVTETTSAWTGQKKTKIQSTPTPGEHSGKIVGGQEQEREEIEGLDWDDDTLAKKIDDCLRLLKDLPLVDEYASDDESSLLNEEQLRVLNRRLALCRIRAHEGKYHGMDDESMSEDFPLSILEDSEYYKHYELSFEWYFDPVYSQYIQFQDYQLLMPRNNGEYDDWEYYRRICSTLEGDQGFIQFWEKLSSKTELIEWYMTKTNREEPRTGRLFYYHVLKIAAGHPNVCKNLIDLGFFEFRHHLQIDFTWSRDWANFLFEMQKLLTEDKLSFEDALNHVYHKHSFIFPCPEFEQNLRLFEELCKPLLDRTVETVDKADVKGLIMEFVKGGNEGKPNTYYAYAKKKLGIAKKIGLIPSPPTEAPRDKVVHDHTVKQGIGSKE